MNGHAYLEVNTDRWLPGGLSFESSKPVLITPPLAPPGVDPMHEIFLFEAAEIIIPEIEGVSVVLPGSVGGAPLEVIVSEKGVGSISAPLVLRIRSDVLRALKPGTDEVDAATDSVDIDLGAVTLSISQEGEIKLVSAASISAPRCMIGRTGLVIEATDLRFIAANDDDPFALAPGAPGVALEGVTVEVPGAFPGQVLTMENVFIGAGGFWGLVSFEDRNLDWNGTAFEGAMTGDLLGFPGGLHSVGIELRQSAFVGARLEGDVFFPFLDIAVGVTLGLDGNGGVTAAVGPSSSAAGAAASDRFLLETKVGNFLSVGISRLAFESSPRTAVVIDGEFELDVPILDAAPVSVSALRIFDDGTVSVEGGWIDLEQAIAASVGGFPIEITRLGLGSEKDSGRRWLGLNGTVRMAAGLPAGASVEGLRLSWDPSASNVSSTLRVSLDGIGVELAVPKVFSFSGSVAFFDDNQSSGFRGHGKLNLVALGMEIDAGIVIGQTLEGNSFFFFRVDLELPTGIPLFTTGTALYGLSGLVADDMGPDRADNEDWYYDWYKRPAVGATDPAKWTPREGAFAAGLGATVGTAFDDGFTFMTKCLFVVVLPGPQILISGKGNFLTSRKSEAEGAFDALLVLDTPGRLFQANLSAQYEIPLLISARGNVDVGFSWASPPPPDLWHLWLGQYEPKERRIGVTWLEVLQAEAWLMVDRQGIDLGGWAGINKSIGFPPVASVTIDIGIQGRGQVAWDPLHFMGELQLGGTVGVRAFGVGVTLIAEAELEAQAPTPYWLRIELFAALEIDLFLFSFSFSHTVVLEWGDRNQPLPEPSPPIDRIAFEHERVRLSLPAGDAALVPPDVRPVVIFKRPVRDPSGVAEPAVPVAEEAVGEFKYFHEVAQIGLYDGAGELLSSVGFGMADGDRLRFNAGISLEGAAGATVELQDLGSFNVTSVSGDHLVLDRSTGQTGEYVAYRLRGPIDSLDLTLVHVSQSKFSTRSVRVRENVDGEGALNGGTLVATDGRVWRVLGGGADELVVKDRSDSAEPPTGSATLFGRASPMIGGSWLAGTGDDLGNTRLMLWASNPFAWFRSSDADTRDIVEQDGKACGPPVEEGLTCIPLGPDELFGAKEGRILQHIRGAVAFSRKDGSMRVHLGPRSGTDGTLIVDFDPPVDHLEVHGAEPEEFVQGHEPMARAVGLLDGTEAFHLPLSHGRTSLNGPVDEIQITGSNFWVLSVCSRPQWRCFRPELELEDGSSLAFQDPDRGLTLSSSASHRNDGGFRAFSASSPFLEIPDFLRRSHPRFRRRLRSPFLRGGGTTFFDRAENLPDTLRRNVSLVIDFDQPATRLRVKLGSPAEVAVFVGDERVAATSGGATDDVILDLSHQYFDRVVIAGKSPLKIGRFCWDAGNLGWQHEGRLIWRRSLERAVTRFSDESPVFDPGSYRIAVAAVTTVIAPDLSETRTPTKQDREFEVGPPPGLGEGSSDSYPDAGPLSVLNSYVARSRPRPGQKPVYRADDIAVSFDVNYVARMYLAADAPMSIRVLDASGQVSRQAAHNGWGGTRHRLRRDEETWMASLHSGAGCADLDLDRVALDESLTGSGNWMTPSRLQVAEIRAKGRALYRLEFISSRYGSFRHHMAFAERRLLRGPGGNSDPGFTPLLESLVQHRAETSRVRSDLLRVITRSGSTPDRDDLEARANLEQRLEAKLESEIIAERAAFDHAAQTHAIRTTGPLSPRPVISRLPGMLLVESPEPLHVHRLRARLLGDAGGPLRLRAVVFDRRFLGDPDQGIFQYQGLEFESSREVRCRNGVLQFVGGSEWMLKVRGRALAGVRIEVEVGAGGHARLSAVGEGVPPPEDTPAGQEGAFTLHLAGERLDGVMIHGTGFALVSLAVVERAIDSASAGALCLEEIVCPDRDGDDKHSVALIAREATDLEGMRLEWDDARNPTGRRVYHEFAAEILKEGDRLVVQAGRVTPMDVTGSRVRAGGIEGSPPAGGLTIFLVDANDAVADCSGALAKTAYQTVDDLVLVANADQTRMIVASTSGVVPSGHSVLELDYDRDAGRPWPVQMVHGSRIGERIVLALDDRD